MNLTNITDIAVDENELQLSEIEKKSIEKVLIKNNYNISKSAEELGLSRAALYRRIEKYEIGNG